MKNKQQLSDEQNQIVAARSRLGLRRSSVEERLDAIDKEYVAALLQFAESGNLAELQELEAEKMLLLVALQAPYLAAYTALDNRLKSVRAGLDNINTIEKLRAEDAEFAKFFNSVLQRRSLQAGDEERLWSYATGRPALMEQVNTLISQLQCFAQRGFGPNPIPFEQVVNIAPLPEEPDNSEITVNA